MNLETNSKEINICLQNHGKQKMVSDCLAVVSAELRNAGFIVNFSKSFSVEMPNIIIDEFTNYHFNRSIKRFKKDNPSAQIFVVLTEFFTKRWGVESFNYFGGILGLSLIALLRVLIKIYRNDLGKITVLEVIRAIILMPLAFIKILLDIRFWIIGKINPLTREQVYFLIRHMGVDAARLSIDGWLSLHPSIARDHQSRVVKSIKNKYLGTIYPRISSESINFFGLRQKNLGVMFSGTLTSFRKNFFLKFNSAAMRLGVKSQIGSVCIRQSDNEISCLDKFFSFHPPKLIESKYSSPVRLYRALEIDKTVPIITFRDYQHPIEDICFFYKDRFSICEIIDMYLQWTEFSPIFIDRIQKYNEYALISNRTTLTKLKNIIFHSVI